MISERYQECITVCRECAVVCNDCAITCLSETSVKELAGCIQQCIACTSICNSSVEVMSLDSRYSESICAICADVCYDCAAECRKHTDITQCVDCAEMCRKCAEACANMIGAPVD